MTVFPASPEPLVSPQPGVLAAAPQWWYTRLYTGGIDASDDVIVGILPPLLAEVRALGASRWFFLRYVDRSGPHLRLRVFGPGRSLDRLVRSTRDLGEQLELIVNRSRQPQVELVSGAHAAVFAGAGTAVGLRPAVYEPEIAKYGGTAGIGLAEQLFEFSSELALWAVAEGKKGGSRDALAVLLLTDGVGALVRGAWSASWPTQPVFAWSRVWQEHARWWIGAASGDDEVRRRLDKQAAAGREQFAERVRSLLAEPVVEAWRRRWGRAMEDYLAAAGRVAVSSTAQNLVFHQNHMLMNRLGYAPFEEALLGMYARDWGAPLHD
ncbi:hypothetical protein C5C66_02000 [Rathayibacter toxicus]|uniref:Thiopeptide-type bacteriocin biosynthesis domain-containing protein n=1 Tax=Rathayibacter toxicus TaxID=145458 RepID=A0A2S5Y8E1_9MICO|nr:hypothetical protein C5D15_01980 [Rathayibacter toxicus]PPG47626.1 hypothetical protein C5D16_01975 [Rathayibacter toxicus]PPH24765.1 hypothetical protein C5D17_01940 [Rathayibacter toxicus]PPH58693.1 hypothetical protein C5D30_01965 [Rathayibacter toxicus]PPH60685.1 hypothetical protein C5C93_01990 [Rathayibacter toxicus]